MEKRRLCQVHQVVVAPVELQQLGITWMLDLADSFLDKREVRSAKVRQIRIKAAGASGTPVALNATARPRPGRCRLLPHHGYEEGGKHR